MREDILLSRQHLEKVALEDDALVKGVWGALDRERLPLETYLVVTLENSLESMERKKLVIGEVESLRQVRLTSCANV